MIIDHLTIENFQCFSQPVRISFAPLTFLYGPNSAGKSAIFDAFALLQEILDGNVNNPMGPSSPLAEKWARVDPNGSGALLPIRLKLEYRDAWYAKGGLFGDHDAMDAYLKSIDRALLASRSSYWGEGFVMRSVAITYESGAIEENYAIGATKLFALDVDGYRVLEFSGRNGDDLYGRGDGKLKLWAVGPFAYLESDVEMEVDGKTGGINSYGNSFFRGHYDSPWQLVAVNDFLGDELFSGFSAECLKPPSGPLRWKLVGGDRTVITPPQCSFHFSSNRSHVWGDDPKGIKGLVGTVQALRELTASYINSGMGFEEDDKALARRKPVVGPFWQRRARQTELVNQALSDLFHVGGYQLVFNVEQFKRIRNVRRSAIHQEDEKSYEHVYRTEASVYLTDAKGHRLEFEDVGSGVSFVLPILVALVDIENAFIQQPELHLHPAMQSKLADIFIERVNGTTDARAMIETHSEYFLLRALRRIRETHAGRLSKSDLRLTADDVLIYYFDPQDDGTTQITEIPVNEFGDFLKPWPKGFFEERAQDMFDD